MQKIIIADDEPRIRTLVSDFLKREGYIIIEAEDGRAALDAYEDHKDAALIILDVMMPRLDGWTVCREIRKQSQIPIVMLTARSEEFDELHGFEIGADDYVTKPFSPSVLLARVNARLRKANKQADGGIIQAGNLTIDCTTHQATLNGEMLDLSPKEFELLLQLAGNVGRVFSREQLLYQIWGYDYFGGTRTVDTHIGRLRIKLGDYGEVYIKTVRGYGYKYEAGDI